MTSDRLHTFARRPHVRKWTARRAAGWTIYVLLVAAGLAWHSVVVWRDSVAALDDQLIRSLIVTRGEVEAWGERHRAFVGIAASFLDSRQPELALARLERTLTARRGYDASWITDADASPLATWTSRERADPPPAIPSDTTLVPVGRCPDGFCAYFAHMVPSEARGPRLIVRTSIGDTTFPQINPVKGSVRTGRTAIVARAFDSIAVVASRGGGDRDLPRVRAAGAASAHVLGALDGRQAHGIGTGLSGARVIYAALPVASTGWAIVRELDVSEVASGYRRAMLVSESIIAALLLSLGALVDYWVRARRAARDQQLAAVRSDFVAGVSHELRTPLAQIRMFAELLRNGTLRTPQEAERALSIIEKETKRLTILVDNVLNFTRIRKRTDGGEFVPCNVGEEIELAADAFTPLAAERESEVVWSAPSLYVAVDSLALRQILINFLENAVKYGPRGQTVRVTVERTARTVRVHVDDEGEGVPPAEREEIWRAFYRRDSAVRTGETGSGIGLSVARDLALQYAGNVSVTDAPGGGARFTAEFPLADAAATVVSA